MRDLQAAAPALGMRLHIMYASTESELDTVFPALGPLRADALVVGPYTFFNSHTEKLGALSLRYAVPAIYTYRPFVAAGGLMSYGADEAEIFRLIGIYTAKILKGANPRDLPVQRSTKVELTIQPQDCQGARHRGSARAERPSRRTDRVEMPFDGCMSLFMAHRIGMADFGKPPGSRPDRIRLNSGLVGAAQERLLPTLTISQRASRLLTHCPD